MFFLRWGLQEHCFSVLFLLMERGEGPFLPLLKIHLGSRLLLSLCCLKMRGGHEMEAASRVSIFDYRVMRLGIMVLKGLCSMVGRGLAKVCTGVQCEHGVSWKTR